MRSPDLYPGNAPLGRLVDALAKQAAADYLTELAAEKKASATKASKPVPLLPADKAA